MKIKFIPIAAGILLLFQCCQKDDATTTDPTGTSSSKTNLLTGTIWKLTVLTVDPALPMQTGGPAISDWYAQMPACSKDDIYSFKKDSTYYFEEGATKCNVNNSTVTEFGKWSFNSTQTVILMNAKYPTANAYEFQLISLTAKKITATVKRQNTNGTIYTFSFTFEPN